MENIKENYTNLCDWISKNGGWVNPKLTIEQTEKFGKSIITTSDIINEGIFIVPKSICLNPKNSGLNLDGIFEYRDQVVISLLKECQNPDTNWAPYIKLLPDLSSYLSHPLVVFYQNKLPNSSTTIFNRVSELYQSFMKFFNDLKSYNDVNNIFVQMPNFNECIWAFLTVITRMWAGSGLVPFADLLQHSNRSTMALDLSDDNCKMTSKETITSGSAIYDNYLVQDDITLYVNFGFVEESEITNLSINFSFETHSPIIASVINTERQKLNEKKIFISTQGINSDLMSFLRLHLLDSTDLKLVDLGEGFYNNIITLQNELRCLQKLKFRIAHVLEQSEVDYATNNIDKFEPYSTEWNICKLVLNIQNLKLNIHNFIEGYWKSFI
jgi:hypothetical protein